jgi:hypothetical protein
MGANCTFTFHGDAIWVYGGTRKNHGVYDVTFDGQTTSHDGHHDPDLYQQVLFSATGLSNTNHTVVFTDASDAVEANYLDIDYVSRIEELAINADRLERSRTRYKLMRTRRMLDNSIVMALSSTLETGMAEMASKLLSAPPCFRFSYTP